MNTGRGHDGEAVMNALDRAPQNARLLLGQAADPLSHLKAGFQEASPISWTQVAVFCGIAAVLLFVAWRVARRLAMHDGRSYFSSKRLFLELCQTHGLDWPSRRLLGQLASAREPAHPARVFVEPTWFQTAAIPETLRPYRQELEVLRRQLFED